LLQPVSKKVPRNNKHTTQINIAVLFFTGQPPLILINLPAGDLTRAILYLLPGEGISGRIDQGTHLLDHGSQQMPGRGRNRTQIIYREERRKR
jgi:hypothetical protein